MWRLGLLKFNFLSILSDPQCRLESGTKDGYIAKTSKKKGMVNDRKESSIHKTIAGCEQL